MASAAIVENDVLIGEYNVQYKKTHSQTASIIGHTSLSVPYRLQASPSNVGISTRGFPMASPSGDSSEMDEIGYEEYIYGEGVCLIEWADLIEEILPPRYLKVTIEKDVEKGYLSFTLSQPRIFTFWGGIWVEIILMAAVEFSLRSLLGKMDALT